MATSQPLWLPLVCSSWCNPDLKIHHIVKYLMDNSNNNSRTWSIYMKHISKMYDIEDPSKCLAREPPGKYTYKNYIKAKITVFHERELRKKAEQSEKMIYFNVSLNGLSGRPHPAMLNINTTNEVQNSRPHLKMLCGDYITFWLQSKQYTNISPECRLCYSSDGGDGGKYIDNIEHILTSCYTTQTIRSKILTEVRALCKQTKNKINFGNIEKNNTQLCQFM